MSPKDPWSQQLHQPWDDEDDEVVEVVLRGDDVDRERSSSGLSEVYIVRNSL